MDMNCNWMEYTCTDLYCHLMQHKFCIMLCQKYSGTSDTETCWESEVFGKSEIFTTFSQYSLTFLFYNLFIFLEKILAIKFAENNFISKFP